MRGSSDRRAHRRLARAGGLAALALLASGLATTAVQAAAPRPAPVLGTPEQTQAERTLLALLRDPELKALQTKLRAELAATPTGQTPDGAARLDEALGQWTRSLIFKEIANYRATPAILWGTDDTPRRWLGHTVGGVGTAGDNPDNIYRLAFLDGAGRYEILGRFDPAHRPAQFSLEVVRGDAIVPAKVVEQTPNRADMGNQLAVITDRELTVGADGSFRITLGGEGDGGNHLATESGPITLAIRDTFSDWSQRPTQLTLRRLDEAPPAAFDRAELRRRVLAKLGDYVRFWSAFGDSWFGGLEPNTFAGPVARDGGWGFVAGLRFKLEPGEAILVTTDRGEARYTGFQVTDPWMITPDVRKHQSSLNLAQSAANTDGSYTFVISPEDPGAANWLDTGGLREGFAVIRWQGFPPGATKDGLLRDFRVVKIGELTALAGLARVSPPQRQAQLKARATSHANRLR